MSASKEVSLEPGLQADQALLDKGWLRVGAGMVVAAQAMVFSFAINLEEVDGVWVRWVVNGLLIFSAVLPLVWLGGDLLRSAWESLVARKVSIDLLFLVTLLGAFVGSLTSTLTGKGAVYYEVVSILIVVHSLGKMLGARSRLTALRAVEGTRETFAVATLRKENGELVPGVSVDKIKMGGLVAVAPGGPICIDGRVVSGRAYVNETSITGEWKPVTRSAGDCVWAGSHALDGDLVIEKTSETRRLDAVLEAVSRSRLAPSRVQEEADRLMRWFLPLVTGTSLVTFWVWWRAGSWQEALFHAMAVLLVACPCAMGLATPVAIWGGLAALSRYGVVARTGDFLAELARIDHVCFDKTGTLSEERLVVKEWTLVDGGVKLETLKSWVASLESGVRHPVALALSGEGNADLNVVERKTYPGQGIEGVIDGRVVRVGERSFAWADEDGDADSKMVYVSVEGRRAARIVLSELWRQGTEEVVTGLEALGITSEVLSGDPGAVRALPGMASVTGGLSAAEKAQAVEQRRAAGKRVLFVGDGVNDAAAMACADLAISIKGGAALAGGASGAVFAGDNLQFLPQCIGVARSTLRGVRFNLFFAAGYNVLGMALAAAGKLHPVAAALLMVGSSLFVSVFALRSSRPRT